MNKITAILGSVATALSFYAIERRIAEATDRDNALSTVWQAAGATTLPVEISRLSAPSPLCAPAENGFFIKLQTGFCYAACRDENRSVRAKPVSCPQGLEQIYP